MSDYPIKSPRKLIEVALPLDAINAACAKEKSIRHGHPSTLHLWWARRPLAAARAVIFAQLVNDPAGLWEAQNTGKRPNQQQRGAFTKRRKELFDLIKKLVLWENTTNEKVLEPAREEIRRSWREVCELNKDHPQAAELFNPDKLPALHDPFAGGGAIPLEAQRLGLEAYASDLNPVAVLINKAMIEIPPKFAGRPPVHPQEHSPRGTADSSNHILTNAWDNFAMGGNGSFDLWWFDGKYYVAIDGINYEDDRPDPATLADMEGPFDDVAHVLKQNAGNILSIGSATQAVSSSLHTVDELRKLLRVESCLLEGEDDLEEWFIEINGIKHRVDAKTFDIQPVAGGKKPKQTQGQLDVPREWPGATGLAEDVRYYGAWMREEAQKRIGHLYPPVEITAEMAKERPDLKPLVGQKLTVIAWLWARTVKSPNPAFSHVDVPLASNFLLSTKLGKEAYVKPIVEGDRYRFSVIQSVPPPEAKTGTKLARANFVCLMSGAPISGDHVKSEAKLGRLGARMLAIVAESQQGRVYLSPIEISEAVALQTAPRWKPEIEISGSTQYIGCKPYGIDKFSGLFTNRQLVMLGLRWFNTCGRSGV